MGEDYRYYTICLGSVVHRFVSSSVSKDVLTAIDMDVDMMDARTLGGSL